MRDCIHGSAHPYHDFCMVCVSGGGVAMLTSYVITDEHCCRCGRRSDLAIVRIEAKKLGAEAARG